MYFLTLLDGAGLTTADGHRVQSVTAQPKRFAILALLALAPDGRMPRSRVAGLLWPDVDPDRARGSLRTALYGLRRSLGPDVLERGGDEDLALDRDAVSCDVTELRGHLAADRVPEALALYRGPLLNGFDIAGCAELEWEIDRHRTRLESDVVRAGVEGAEAALAASDADRVVALTDALRGIRPLDERVMRVRVAGLVAQGNHARAAREATRFRAALLDELGVEPSARTEAAFAGIASRSESGGDADAGPPIVRTPDPPSTARRPPWIERVRTRRAVLTAVVVLAGLGTTAIVARDRPAMRLPAGAPMAAGETALRHGRYQEAVEAFRDAVRADTASGRAYYKLAIAAEWAGMHELARTAVAEARARTGGLSASERASLGALETYLRGQTGAARDVYRSVVRAYPENLDAWAQLAEIDFHWGPMLGVPVEEAAPAFERLLAADARNGEALLHLARLDARLGDAATLDRRTRTLAERPLSLMQATEIGLLRRLHGLEANVGAVVAAAPSRDLVAEMLTLAPPDAVLGMIDTLGDELPVGDWLWAHLARAVVEASRGRWTAVGAALDSAATLVPARAVEFRAALALPPRSPPLDGRTRDRIAGLDDGPSIGPGPTHLAVPTIFQPRRAFLAAFFDRAPPDDVSPRPTDGMNFMNADLFAGYERARLCHRELAAGNPRAALHYLRSTEPPAHGQMPTLLDYPEALARWCRAEALFRAGDLDQALRWFETFPHPRGHDLPWLPAALIRRAEIHEERGEADAARALYRRLADRLAHPEGPSIALRDRALTALDRLATFR